MTRQIAQAGSRWLIAASIGALMGIGPGGCTPDISEIRELGIAQYNEGEYMESTATLRRALNAAPSDAQSNYYMGMNYRTIAAQKFDTGDFIGAYRELDTAIVFFTQAVKSWPNYMAAIDAKNEALESRGKYAAALALAEGVTVRTRGYSAEHMLYLGDEYFERADYDNALQAYQLTLESKPDWAAAHAALGRLYERVQKPYLAKQSYERAYDLNASEPGVADALARLRSQTRVNLSPQP